MPLNIKNPEADRLARQLAQLTGESLTDAVTRALEERLQRVRGRYASGGLEAEVRRIQERLANLPVLDGRSDEEIVGYDETGAPE